MKNVSRTPLLMVALVLAGCVNVQSTRLGAGPMRPPTTPDRIAIYRTAEQVPHKYEEVALLSASGDYMMTNEEQMYKKLREAAAKLGANGVILDSVTEPTTGNKVAYALIGVPAARKGKALAVYILQPEATNSRAANPAPTPQ